VSVFILTVLKIVFLAVLYLFVYRAIRWVVIDLRAPSPWTPGTGAADPGTRPPSASDGRDKPPKTIVVTNERGARVATIPLSGTAHFQIGRAEACQVQVSDTYVSSFHARIFSRDGAWYVEDLGSTNGTYLNQRKVVSAAPLRTGDRVRVGKTVLELKR